MTKLVLYATNDQIIRRPLYEKYFLMYDLKNYPQFPKLLSETPIICHYFFDISRFYCRNFWT